MAAGKTNCRVIAVSPRDIEGTAASLCILLGTFASELEDEPCSPLKGLGAKLLWNAFLMMVLRLSHDFRDIAAVDWA